jgi:hypothetical protein
LRSDRAYGVLIRRMSEYPFSALSSRYGHLTRVQGVLA